MELDDFLNHRRPSLFKHQCGRAYMRTCVESPPRHRSIICEHCLEPMPICDQNRFSYSYKPLTTHERTVASDVSTDPRTIKRPVVGTALAPLPLSQETFQWSTPVTRQPRRIAFASSTWI